MMETSQDNLSGLDLKDKLHQIKTDETQTDIESFTDPNGIKVSLV